MPAGSSTNLNSSTTATAEATVPRNETETKYLRKPESPEIVLSLDSALGSRTSMDDTINEQFAEILSAFDARFPPQPITSNHSGSIVLNPNDLSNILSRFGEISRKVEKLQRSIDELQIPTRRPLQTPVHYSRPHRGKRQLILEPVATKAEKPEKSS